MKHYLWLTLSLACLLNTEGVAQTTKPKIASKSPYAKSAAHRTTVNTAKIKFTNAKIDLGTIKEDAVIEKNFEFTNVGTKDLVIINAKGSCGCTVPNYSQIPIPPNGKGTIGFKYTAKNKAGPQKPTITVTTNGSPAVVKLELETWVEQIPGGVKD
jgi:hypothetical protein